MTELTNKNLKALYKILTLERNYDHACGVIGFDFETKAPKKTLEAESAVLDFFSNESFKLMNSKKYKALIVYLNEHKEELDDLDKVLITHLYDYYKKTKNVSPSLNLKISRIYSKDYIKWLEAKEKGKYNLFKPAFKKVVEAEELLMNLRDEKLDKLYDNYLNDNEQGLLEEDLDKFFSDLKEGLVELIDKIKKSKHKIRTDFLSRKVPIHKQEEFSDYLLKLNGFDFERGAIATTEHPFTSPISKDDARVTTHYYEDAVISNMFSIIHEGGHALLMQNQREIDYDHFLNDYASNAKHESVSRFYENVIGRSREYIHLIYPKFMEIFKDEFSDVSEEELYEAVNVVNESLIRTEADEVTYGLHIVIRYEMEKKIVNKEIDLKDANKEWNRLYKEYLHVSPKNDKEGILQDVHWTSGFGYFPSYAIGNGFNAMYLERIKQDLDFNDLVSKGDFKTINAWMKANVYEKANVLDSKKWIRDITGKDLDAKYFLKYLNDKYSKIYRFII